ncbi:MAG: dihydrolipoyl dehydrogenase [Chloroflexi bacterium]|nr:dihydrolipoyl dehydrogenase [Chloroflexota bacterium]
MKEYDVMVIGSGCGMNIVMEAVAHKARVALVDKGPLGGTCPNLGCIPSKTLIYPADRVLEIQEAKKLGIAARVEDIDFGYVMQRMRRDIEDNLAGMREGISRSKELDFYEGRGEFVAERTLEVNGARIRADKVFIASGSRPLVPPLKGLDGVDYLTSETVLQLTERPESLVIVGGGYVAVEYAHFFAAMGSRVTVLEMEDRLLLGEEPEIAALLEAELRKRLTVVTGARAEEVRKTGDGVEVLAVDRKDGKRRQIEARRIMLAAGRRSNADLLKVEKAGIETDHRGYIKVNEYLETNQKGVYAVGDANGQQMFTHVANAESVLAAHNGLHGGKARMDYSAAPHAVYSYPQIASVGLTEQEARKRHKALLVGRANYSDVAKGQVMLEERGFAKAVVSPGEEGRILGFHVIGPLAPVIVQEVVNAMAAGGHVDSIRSSMHIHPEIPELVVRTLGNLEEVD